jgi:hypothetical protein
MKKKLNEAAIASELRQGSAFFRDAVAMTDAAEQSDEPVNQPTALSNGASADPSPSPAVSQSTTQPTDPSTSQSTGEQEAFDTSPILGRPKAFYISEQQDLDLDVAVDKLAKRLRGRGNQKIDRSTVMRLLLEVNNLTDDETTERLASQFVRRLVSQLTG